MRFVIHGFLESQDEDGVAAGLMLGNSTQRIKEYIDFALESENHNHGVYYFGIVACTCYVESVLEEYCYHWCFQRFIQDEGMEARLMESIAKDVSRSTGLDVWKKWFKTLYNIDLPGVVGKNWEPLTVLFTLRNQLAHGRSPKFNYFWNARNGRF